MKEFIMLILKGMIIGLANVIPGVSGGTLMITLGIYERVINAISHFFKNFKENMKFLIPLGIGMGLAIILLSKVISFCLGKFPFPTTLFFIGLILGGIPLLWKKVGREKKKANYGIIFTVSFGIVLLFTFLNANGSSVDLVNLNFVSYLKLFFMGVIASSTMIIPGISGSFMLMLFGYYEGIIGTVSNITNFALLGYNLSILVPFGIGVLIGIVLVAKLIEFLIKKYEVATYYGVLGFVLASIIAIIKPLFIITISPLQVVIGIVLLIWGYIAAYKLAK